MTPTVLLLGKNGQVCWKIKATKVASVPISTFTTPEARPHNSRPYTRKLQSTFQLQLTNWQLGVARILDEVF